MQKAPFRYLLLRRKYILLSTRLLRERSQVLATRLRTKLIYRTSRLRRSLIGCFQTSREEISLVCDSNENYVHLLNFVKDKLRGYRKTFANGWCMVVRIDYKLIVIHVTTI